MTKSATNKLKDFKGPMLGAATKGYDAGIAGKGDGSCPYKIRLDAKGKGTGLLKGFKKAWLKGLEVGKAENGKSEAKTESKAEVLA